MTGSFHRYPQTVHHHQRCLVFSILSVARLGRVMLDLINFSDFGLILRRWVSWLQNSSIAIVGEIYLDLRECASPGG